MTTTTRHRRQQWAELIPVNGVIYCEADPDESCEVCGDVGSAGLILQRELVMDCCERCGMVIEFTGQDTYVEEQ